MSAEAEQPNDAEGAGQSGGSGGAAPSSPWPKRLLFGGVGLFVLLQFIPVDRTNPPVEATPTWDSPRTQELFDRACKNCHSNETHWPWYSYVAPASWLVAHDVHEARDNFNASAKVPGDGDDAEKELKKGKMPPWQYLLLHPEAKLTDAEKADLIKGMKATFPE